MFRNKKVSDDAPPATGHEARSPKPAAGHADEAERVKPAPRRPMPTPARTLSGANFPFELPRRTAGDGSSAPSRPEAAAPAGRENTMTVGRDVHLRGEVVTCDRLIVDGRTEVSVNDCRQVQIGRTGVFRGNFDVREAEISGDFEGDITVRECMTVRATGKVRGRIRYRHLIIEAGGLIIGDVDELEPSVKPSPEAAPVPASAPAQGDERDAEPPVAAADRAHDEPPQA